MLLKWQGAYLCHGETEAKQNPLTKKECKNGLIFLNVRESALIHCENLSNQRLRITSLFFYKWNICFV